MYCKNCGRHLKEGLRFCDRCGQSVRKNQSRQTSRQQEIEELKAERLNRKRRLENKEAKQALNKKRKKKSNGTVLFIIIILLIALASVLTGLCIGSCDSGKTQSTNTIAATSAPTASPNESVTKNGYTIFTIGDVKCPYPSDFHSNPLTGKEKLSVTDALGGATMTVSQDGKNGEPKDLMLEYLNEIGGKESYSHAGSEWYSITINSNGKVYHRKCLVRNGITIYYDFIYNEGSASESKYTEYINHIDANFK